MYNFSPIIKETLRTFKRTWFPAERSENVLSIAIGKRITSPWWEEWGQNSGGVTTNQFSPQQLMESIGRFAIAVQNHS